MKKPKKVKVDNNRFHIYKCPRCRQDYCSQYNPPNKVDFNVEDCLSGWDEIQWKNWAVCPWCYNQLKHLT